MGNATTGKTPAKQEEGSPEFLDADQPPSGGGGLVGIITSLSGVSIRESGAVDKLINFKDVNVSLYFQTLGRRRLRYRGFNWSLNRSYIAAIWGMRRTK